MSIFQFFAKKKELKLRTLYFRKKNMNQITQKSNKPLLKVTNFSVSRILAHWDEVVGSHVVASVSVFWPG